MKKKSLAPEQPTYDLPIAARLGLTEESDGPSFWPVVGLCAVSVLVAIGLCSVMDNAVIPAIHGIARIMDAPARLDAQQKDIEALKAGKHNDGWIIWDNNVILTNHLR